MEPLILGELWKYGFDSSGKKESLRIDPIPTLETNKQLLVGYFLQIYSVTNMSLLLIELP